MFNIELPWSRLVHHLSLLGADCKLEVVLGIRELVNVVLHVSLGGSIEDAVIRKQEVVDAVC